MKTETHPSPFGEKHSEHFFTDARDFWWNEDFLHLMAKRWGIDTVHSVLEIGCGVGHWTSALLRVLPKDAAVTAVDREPEWVKKSQERFGSRVKCLQSTAEKLPFPDHSFDMVTCQTLLIHVADPNRVIQEMLRVLKPNGLLAVAEPSNIAQTHDSVETTPDEATALFRLNMICERGKIALGEGNSSLGDLLPGIFSSIGIGNIQVYTGDKAAALYPPYAGAGQKEALADRLRDAETGYYMFGLEQTRKYFLAGGGSADEFDRIWNIAQHNLAKVKTEIVNERFHSAGGSVMYLVSGRKQ